MNILNLNNLVRINTNIASVVHKSFAPIQLCPQCCCYCDKLHSYILFPLTQIYKYCFMHLHFKLCGGNRDITNQKHDTSGFIFTWIVTLPLFFISLYDSHLLLRILSF